MRLRSLLAVGSLLAALGAAGGAQADSPKLKFYVNFIGGPEIQFFAVVKKVQSCLPVSAS